MTLSPSQVGLLVSNAVLFLVVYVSNKTAFEESWRWCMVGLALGVVVAVGFVLLPPSFAADVGRGLGGPSVAMLLIWGNRQHQLSRTAARRSVTYTGAVFETARRLGTPDDEVAYDFVERLRDGGALGPDEAAGLQDQLRLFDLLPPNNAG